MTHRREQVASTIQRAVEQVISRGLSDPRIRGLITVTSVDVPPDLKTAIVNISVLPEERQELTVHGLQDASRHIRREVGDIVDMRVVPDLIFRLDLSLKRQAKAMEAISKAAAERAQREAAKPADQTPAQSEENAGEDDR